MTRTSQSRCRRHRLHRPGARRGVAPPWHRRDRHSRLEPRAWQAAGGRRCASRRRMPRWTNCWLSLVWTRSTSPPRTTCTNRWSRRDSRRQTHRLRKTTGDGLRSRVSICSIWPPERGSSTPPTSISASIPSARNPGQSSIRATRRDLPDLRPLCAGLAAQGNRLELATGTRTRAAKCARWPISGRIGWI